LQKVSRRKTVRKRLLEGPLAAWLLDFAKPQADEQPQGARKVGPVEVVADSINLKAGKTINLGDVAIQQ
jgi:hypothetical protein